MSCSCGQWRGGRAPPMTPVERVRADYGHTEVTTGAHPMKLIRDQLNDVWPADELKWCATGQRVTIAGAVTCRQGVTRRAVVFVTLEDETGTACLLRGRTPGRRQRLRRQCAACPHHLLRQTYVHPTAAELQRLTSLLPPALSSPSSDRKLLLPHQASSSHQHSLRQTRFHLFRLRSARRRP